MAREVGVSQGSVSGWLNGAVPKMDKIARIAEVLQVTPDRLLFPLKYSAPFDEAETVAELSGADEKKKKLIYNDEVMRRSAHLNDDQMSFVTGARAKLRHARENKGYSLSQMARLLGYSDVGTYIAIEEGRSQMGEKMARKAANLLGLDVSDLMSGSDHPVERGAVTGTFGAVPEIRMTEGMKAKFVPLISLAECGPDMIWTDEGYTGDGVLAIDCTDPKAFAVKLSGDSMQPKYDAGDKAIIFPSCQPFNGDLVLAKLKDEHGGDVMIKLYQASAGNVTLSSYNPAYAPIVWPRSAFAFIYPVDQILHSLRNRNRS